MLFRLGRAKMTPLTLVQGGRGNPLGGRMVAGRLDNVVRGKSTGLCIGELGANLGIVWLHISFTHGTFQLSHQ